MTITDKQITAGGQGGSLSQEHGAGVGIMAEQMMQDAAGKTYLFTRTGLTASVLPGWDNLSSRCTP